MYNANIEKTTNTKNNSLTTISLGSADRRKLKTRTTGYRKLAAAAREAGVNRNTLYNAMAGKKLMPSVAAKILSFLNPQPIQN